MGDKKLSELTALGASPASDDEVYLRDVSEAAADESKRVTIAHLLSGGIVRTATKVVAANDADATVKLQADYVCDGTADDVEIQAAIDALPAGGGKVVLSEGAFNIVTEITVDDKVEICGQGVATNLVAITADMYVIHIVNKDDVTVRDLWIDMGATADQGIKTDTATSVNIKIINVKVSNSPAAGTVSVGLGFGNAEDVLVQNCSFDAIHDYAVATDACLRVKIEGCHSYNGIGELAFNTTTADSTMVGNTIEIVEASSIGIKLNYGNNCTISGNVITSSSKTDTHGIVLGNSGCNDNVVIGNIIKGFLVGIHLNVHPYRTRVEGNNISDCTTGILEASGAEYSSINNNTIDSCTTGIDLSLFYGTMNGNRISNGTVGIYLDNYSRIGSIVGNHINTMQQEAIKCLDSAGVYNLSIVGNSILDAGIETANTYDAISLGGIYNIVQANDIRSLSANRMRRGITELSTGDYNDITHNTIVNTATYPRISIVGSHSKVTSNIGNPTENSGTATVLNTATSIAVAHGLAATPTRIQITPRENPTNAVSFWWVDTIGAANFTINIDADPGASNLDFDWHAQVGEG